MDGETSVQIWLVKKKKRENGEFDIGVENSETNADFMRWEVW